MEVRAFSVSLDDLIVELQKDPVQIKTKAIHPQVSDLLQKFNQDIKDKNYREAVLVGKGLLAANLMPYAEESKFNLCVNIARSVGMLIPEVDRMKVMMDLIRNNYNSLDDIQRLTQTRFE